MTDKTFFMTTAITYTSQLPHIGNTYEAVLADSVARFKGLRATMCFCSQARMNTGRR